MIHLDYEADGELVRRAVQQDARAMREIVDRHKDSVYRLIYRLVGDVDAAQDIAQDTFLKVFQNLGTLENGRALSQWIRTIAGNLVRDRWRTGKDMVEFQEDHPMAPRSTGGRPLRDLQDREIGDRIQDALMEISELNREVFVLKYVDELSYEEIGEMLGISISAAKVRAHRACKMLRDILTELEPYLESGR